MPAKKSGWLTKEGGGWKSWKRRWFVLDGNRLTYHKKEGETSHPLGIVKMELAAHIRAIDIPKKQNKLFCFQIQTPSRTYYIGSDTSEDRQSWLDVLNATLLELNPPPAKTKVGVEDFELLTVVGKGSFGKVMQVKMKSTGQVTHTMSERSILQKVHHPFLVNLHYSFQTEEELYFILDFVNGGELFYHLQREKKFSLERVKFYGAEILLALEHLHNAGVIYRDLKPENLLIANDGHICMTDFGLCKEGLNSKEARTDTFCGTPAPEILLGNGYGKAVDWWSFGSLLYEMLTGLPPFYSPDVQEMYKKIINEKLTFPTFMNEITINILSLLLDRDPKTRLSEPNMIKSHKFFEGIDWEALFKKQIAPPFKPQVAGALDVSQIDPTFTEEQPSLNVGAGANGTPAATDFAGFTYMPNAHKGK